MESTDSESAEDEPEYVQKPYVDIDTVNITLTEVHEQYNKLLLKYSDALNVIDNLKCQLACGINYGIMGALQRDHSVLEHGVRAFNTHHAFVRTGTRRIPDEPRSDLLTLTEGNVTKKTAIAREYDSTRPPGPKDYPQVVVQESTFRAENGNEELFHAPELQDTEEPLSCNFVSVASDLSDESLVSKATVTDDTNKVSELRANNRPRSAPQSRKKSPGQPKHNQVAVVYPALRNAQICTMACCMTHSCCCCKHMENPKKPTCTTETPSQSCFTANFSAPAAPFPQKCLCSDTCSPSEAALFKISSALDTALQLAGQLRKNSVSLLEKW
uniref:Uncharacterized protein n=1 Tax=Amblyomma maculatum TaxID=34609 RepID=G3MR06_AMBMU